MLVLCRSVSTRNVLKRVLSYLFDNIMCKATSGLYDFTLKEPANKVLLLAEIKFSCEPLGFEVPSLQVRHPLV